MAKNAMSKKTIYTDAPGDIDEAITSGERIIDFLPPPDQHVKKPPKDNDILDQYVKRLRNNQNSEWRPQFQILRQVLDFYSKNYALPQNIEFLPRVPTIPRENWTLFCFHATLNKGH